MLGIVKVLLVIAIPSCSSLQFTGNYASEVTGSARPGTVQLPVIALALITSIQE